MKSHDAGSSSYSWNEPPEKYVEEFKTVCRLEFGFLISGHAFIEFASLNSGPKNPFEVHYAKNHGRFVVEGLSYGFSAGVDVEIEGGQRVPFHYFVPHGYWELHREGLGRGPHGDLRYWALCVREFGGPFLNGDWSRHAELLQHHRSWLESNRIAWQQDEGEMRARRAVDRAKSLFKEADYSAVVKLLLPHQAFLTRADAMLFKLACQRAGE